MTNLVISKLRHGARLTVDDEATVLAGLSNSTRVAAHTQLVREGDAPDGLVVVLKGVACRYKNLRDGERHIVALMVPGDVCDVHAPLLRAMDHGIATVGPCTLASVPRPLVQRWIEESPPIRRALNWAALVDEAILREWLVNLGARKAAQRMAHLFCELLSRLRSIGLETTNSFPLPMTQEELGQTLGLSIVHVNRTVGQLRADGLADFRSSVVRIPDVTRLEDFAGFRPNYLHLPVVAAQAQRGSA